MISRRDALAEELARQQAAKGIHRGDRVIRALTSRLFLQQLDLILDPSKRKAILCPRQCGKTWVCATYLFVVALSKPGALCLFLSFTERKSKELIWNDLKRINDEWELGCQFMETLNDVIFPNGSRIQIRGCETAGDIDKFRGDKRHLIIIDECGSFPPVVLDRLIPESLNPSLAVHRGTLVLAGTPGLVLDGTFYQATGPDACVAFHDEKKERRSVARRYDQRELPEWENTFSAWSLHGWGLAEAMQIPNLAHLEQERELEKKRNGWSDESPQYVREWLGKWLGGDTAKVYAFEEGCTWDPKKTEDGLAVLPPGHNWSYILGCDFGFTGAFVVEVAAFAPTSKILYHCYEFSGTRMHSALMADEIKKAQRVCGGFVAMVGDIGGLGTQIINTLSAEHGLYLEPAKKKDKLGHIELVNSDLITRRLQIMKGSKLAKEMSFLTWSDRTHKEEKRDAKRDHCDAFLYLRVHALHHYSADPVPALRPGTPEHNDYLVKQLMQRAEEESARRFATNDGGSYEMTMDDGMWDR